MFRTKDLLLFVSILLFLFTGISFTVVWNKLSTDGESNEVALRASDTDIEATIGGDEFDHTTYINNLRRKLAAGEGQILAGPPVFESVDTIQETETEEDEKVRDSKFISNRVVIKCAVSENIDEILASWPKTGVSIVSLEGARLVISSEEVVVGTATFTSVETVTRTLMQLPINGELSAEPNCLPSDIVGITDTGELIRNTDAQKYIAEYLAGPSELRFYGYARDGFSIYSPLYDDRGTPLDECGGYSAGGVYQYHLREDEDFILGCYAGTPVNFLIQ